MDLETREEPTEITPIPNDPIIRRGVIFSLVVHAVVITGFAIQATFFSTPKPIDFESAIRVDVLGMPEKYTPEDFNTKPAPPEEVKPVAPKPPEAAPEPPKKQPPKPKEETIDLSKNKKKQQQAFEKLKAQSAIDKIKDALAKDKKHSKVIKGNAILPGTSLTGLDKLTHDQYAEKLSHHIKDKWELPQWLQNKNFRTLVRVRFNEQGQIISNLIERTSGNKTFDEYALGAVVKSAPLPAPPEKLTDLVRVDGILIGFPE